MATDEVPAAVWRRAGVDPADVSHVDVARFGDGTGAASGQVQLVIGTLRTSGVVRLVRKTFRELTSGPHAEASRRPEHWAYWRRELAAYRSSVLPTGPDLRAPRLYDTTDDVLYIEHVGEKQPTGAAAAAALGRWHATDQTVEHVDYPWLAVDQLSQRLAASDLDWTTVDLPGLSKIWDQRHDYLRELEVLPRSITHGDFSTGNLRVLDDDLIALDWATLGVSPVGFDIAHLALASLDDSLLATYTKGLEGRYDNDAVSLGYRLTVGLVGASRAHWMATRSIPLPTGYLDFVCAHTP